MTEFTTEEYDYILHAITDDYWITPEIPNVTSIGIMKKLRVKVSESYLLDIDELIESFDEDNK